MHCMRITMHNQVRSSAGDVRAELQRVPSPRPEGSKHMHCANSKLKRYVLTLQTAQDQSDTNRIFQDVAERAAQLKGDRLV